MIIMRMKCNEQGIEISMFILNLHQGLLNFMFIGKISVTKFGEHSVPETSDLSNLTDLQDGCLKTNGIPLPRRSCVSIKVEVDRPHSFIEYA